jgi:hypothetical protein
VVRADVTWYARRLAADLGAKAGDDPLAFILRYAEKRVRAAAKKLHARTLPELLDATAQEVSTRFEIVETDDELTRLVAANVARGETGFAQLPNDFKDSYGVTLRLLKRREWEPERVSVIDCRGSKRYKSYYTKWHELAHLLTLTQQEQLKFRRTHAQRQAADEALMELVAGHFGYWSEILQPHLTGELTFEALTRIRSEQCPEASWQSFVHAAIDRWTEPCCVPESRNGVEARRGAAAESGVDVVDACGGKTSLGGRGGEWASANAWCGVVPEHARTGAVDPSSDLRTGAGHR